MLPRFITQCRFLKKSQNKRAFATGKDIDDPFSQGGQIDGRRALTAYSYMYKS